MEVIKIQAESLFAHVNVPCQDFRGQNLSGVNLHDEDLAYSRFDGVNLTSANLSGALLKCANFTNANLQSADLSNTDLTGARFDNAILDKADLTNAYLSFTNCSNASIRNVRLLGASLMCTQLQGANLLQSSFTGAWIYKTDLSVAVHNGDDSFSTQQLLLDIEVSEQEKLSMQILHTRIQQRDYLTPSRRDSAITVFVRDPNVVAYVRLRSEYRCEMCGWLSFAKDDETMYIEVHHLKPLSEGGQDTPTNSVALCPNCHRHLHYGKDRSQALERLIESLIKKGIHVAPC